MLSVFLSVNCAPIYESLAVVVNGFRGHKIDRRNVETIALLRQLTMCRFRTHSNRAKGKWQQKSQSKRIANRDF